MSFFSKRSTAVMALIALTALPSLWGQATTSLRGTITDAQGAAIESAKVSLEDTQVGIRRNVLTDTTGTYQFLQVPPGAYSITVEKPGFNTVTENGIALQVNTPATLNATMQVATVTSAVNVEAEVAAINTVDASVGNSFNETQVRQLPLQTRNVVELLSLQPGVTNTGEVAGSRRDQNNITLDGVDVNDNQNSGLGGLGTSTKTALPGFNGQGISRTSGFNAALPVPLDSVQEFRVTVAGEGADQGRSSGGQVVLVTKSGTNQFHGSAYEFNRDTVFSANDWFNNQSGVARQPLIRNQYGFSLGGPIKKDRIFYFFNYERRTDRSANTQLSYVPSQAMRQGILTFQNTNGGITTLSPADIKAIDPNHIGVSPAILSMLSQYPVGNNPATGVDSGLNFSGYRFNAPQDLTYNAYVGKMDFHLDGASKHTISLRGTLTGNSETLNPQSFPGQPINNNLLNNSRGLSVSYTGVLAPSLVNVASFGLTRIGFNQTGPTGTAFTLDSISSFVNYTTRGYVRIAPTYNWTDDITWTKGTHTITAGANLHYVRNGYTNFTNSWPSYSFSRGNLTGLGSDWLSGMQSYLASVGGNSTMVNSQAVVRAAGDLLGLISSGSENYIYDHSGNALPIGAPAVRNFATNEYGFYVSDAWRVKPGLTITAGLRYENNSPPWETNGLQVAPTMPLQDYWAARLGGAAAGIPSYLSTPTESYTFNGPGNGKSSWYGRNNLNLAPRVAIAYSPQGDGLGAKILGKGGVFRAGGAIAYDRFGSDMVVQFDTANSFGLTENDILGSFNFASANRYNGAFPALPTASTHAFPFTPPNVAAVCCTYVGIDSDLKTPYSYIVNVSADRPLKGGLTLSVGYQGRFSHALLMQTDIGGVNWDFKDPTGLGTLADQEYTLRNDFLSLSNNRIQAAPAIQQMVAGNPGIVPLDPFTEKYFPGIKNLYINGSATANFLYLLMSNGMSDTDTINQADRLKTVNGKSFPNCISVTGCWTFYAPQQSSLNAWMNTGRASYNSATVTLRRPLSKGFAFDFNYTLSHSIDLGGGAESGRGAYGGLMLSPYNYNAFRGSSDFDQRHNINANFLYELPFGKGKMFLGHASAWVDEIVGGWQVSTIARYHSGLPTSIFYGGIWPTNFSFGAIAYPIDPTFSTNGGTIDKNGNPGLFANPSAASANWLPMYAGSVGSRAAARLAGSINFDIAAAKAFPLPFERQRLQFRAEMFNAFNHANFLNPSLDASSPSTFGEYTQDAGPRVVQLGLRYEF